MSEKGYVVKLGARVDEYVAGMKRAGAETSKLETQLSTLPGRTKDAMGVAAAAVGSTLIAGARTAGTIAGATLATSMALGMGRLVAIDDAEAKLRGLGHTTLDIADIMDSALDSVRGTAFGLGEAATIAASAVAAGVEPGEQLTGYLTMIADTAAIAGTSLGEMGGIINKTTTEGKVFTTELRQLSDRGLPVFQWLAEAYDVSAAGLTEMVQSGQVDAATLQRVLVDNIGGAALAMGDSFSGAFNNTKAAMGRFGAEALRPFFAEATTVFAGVIDVFDQLSGQVGPALEPLADKFGVLVDKFTAWTEVFDLTESGLATFAGHLDGLGPLAIGAGAALTTSFAGALPVVGSLFAGMNPIVVGVGALIAASPVLRDSMGEAFDTAWAAIEPLIPALSDVLASLLSIIEQAGPQLIGGMGDAFAAMVPIVVEVASMVAGLGEAIGAPLLGAFGELASVLASVVSAMPAEWIASVVTGFLLFKGAAGAVALMGAAVGGVTAKFVALRAALMAHPILAVAAIAGAAAVKFELLSSTTRDARERMDEIAASIAGLRDQMERGSTPVELARVMVRDLAGEHGFLRDAMVETGITTERLARAAVNNTDEFGRLTGALRMATETATGGESTWDQLGNGFGDIAWHVQLAATELAELDAVQGDAAGSAAQYLVNARDYVDQLIRMSEDVGPAAREMSEEMQAAIAEVVSSYDGLERSVRLAVLNAAAYTEEGAFDIDAAMTVVDEALTRVQDAADELQARVDSAMSAGASSLRVFSDEGKMHLGFFKRDLEVSIGNLQAWQTNLITIAERGSAEFALQIAELGPDFADVVADIANSTDEDFAGTMMAMLGYTEAAQRDMASEFAKVDPEFRKTIQGLGGMTKLEMELLKMTASQEGFAVGSALAQGVGAGIGANQGAAIGAARGMVDASITAAKRRAGIESPSKLFADEVGEPIAQGIAVGMERAALRDFDPAMERVMGIAMQASIQPAGLPSMMAPSASFSAGDTHVRVFVGDREIKDIVRVEVDQSNGQLVGAIDAGRRA